MKRTLTIAITALLVLTACSSSPSADRYINTTVTTPSTESDHSSDGQTPVSEPIEQEKPKEEPSPSSTDSNEQVTPPSKDKPIEDKPKQEDKKPIKQKVQEAKQQNESISSAATDSILNDSSDKSTSKEPDTKELIVAVEAIRDSVKDLKQQLEAEAEEQVRTVGAQIVEAWDEMKADVQQADSDMAEFVQQKIDKLSELHSAESLDTTALIQLDYELFQAFRQLANKVGG